MNEARRRLRLSQPVMADVFVNLVQPASLFVADSEGRLIVPV